MGARPLGRVIQEHIKKPLAEELLFGKLTKGGLVHVGVKNGEIDLQVVGPEQARALGQQAAAADRGLMRAAGLLTLMTFALPASAEVFLLAQPIDCTLGQDLLHPAIHGPRPRPGRGGFHLQRPEL